MPPDTAKAARRIAELLQVLANECAALAERLAPPPANDDGAVGLTLEGWYEARCAALDRSSEIEDREAAFAAGFQVSRDTIRELRRELAPEHWTTPGRRRA